MLYKYVTVMSGYKREQRQAVRKCVSTRPLLGLLGGLDEGAGRADPGDRWQLGTSRGRHGHAQAQGWTYRRLPYVHVTTSIWGFR